jgi:hypothetical protein
MVRFVNVLHERTPLRQVAAYCEPWPPVRQSIGPEAGVPAGCQGIHHFQEAVCNDQQSGHSTASEHHVMQRVF